MQPRTCNRINAPIPPRYLLRYDMAMMRWSELCWFVPLFQIESESEWHMAHCGDVVAEGNCHTQ